MGWGVDRLRFTAGSFVSCPIDPFCSLDSPIRRYDGTIAMLLAIFPRPNIFFAIRPNIFSEAILLSSDVAS
jgi:hypothetical protein